MTTRYLMAALCAILLLPCITAQSAPRTAADWYDAGMAAKRAGDLNAARADLDAATSTAAWDYADAWWALAWVCSSLGDKQAAAQAFVYAMGQAAGAARVEESKAALDRLVPAGGGWRRLACRSVKGTYWSCTVPGLQEPLVIGGFKGDSPLFDDCMVVPTASAIALQFHAPDGRVPAEVAALLSGSPDLKSRTTVLGGDSAPGAAAGAAADEIRACYQRMADAYHSRQDGAVVALTAPDFTRTENEFDPEAGDYSGAQIVIQRSDWVESVLWACRDYGRPHAAFLPQDIAAAPDGRSAVVRLLSETRVGCGGGGKRLLTHTWVKGADGQGWLLASETTRSGLPDIDKQEQEALQAGASWIRAVSKALMPTAEGLAHLFDSDAARELKQAYEAWAAAISAGDANAIKNTVGGSNWSTRQYLSRRARSYEWALERIWVSARGTRARVWLIEWSAREIRYAEPRAVVHTWLRDAPGGHWRLDGSDSWEGACYSGPCAEAAFEAYQKLGGQVICGRPPASQTTRKPAAG
jgi:hypothetical protein